MNMFGFEDAYSVEITSVSTAGCAKSKSQEGWGTY